jgi:hypothetical protein
MANCTICNGSGMRPGSGYLDCSCGLAEQRMAMNDFVSDLRADGFCTFADLHWAIHQRAIGIAEQAAAARIAELEIKVDAHRAEANGLREAIFPRKIQDSKAWRVVPMSHLGHILMLIDPPAMEVDGKTMVFVNPNAAEVLHRISNLVRTMLDEPIPAAPAPSEVL